MLQRIQSIWLLLAIAFGVFVAINSFGSCCGKCPLSCILGIAIPVLAIFGILLSAIAVFAFKNRRKQMMIIRFSQLFWALVIVLFAVGLLMKLEVCLFAFCAALLAFVFNHFAWAAVRRDEAKVRAADRIR